MVAEERGLVWFTLGQLGSSSTSLSFETAGASRPIAQRVVSRHVQVVVVVPVQPPRGSSWFTAHCCRFGRSGNRTFLDVRVCSYCHGAPPTLFFFFSSFQRDTTSGEEMTNLNSLQKLILNGISRDKEEALR